ncbi:uncharacterized protein LOC141608100 [Silene latifolia]|uniref:uncharacterized protein LOC141608100 n=1 Tax=Silene latifolia TaxID=37657 RepID=UPI003D76E919
MIYKPIRPDHATENKDYLEYARFMVEVKLGQSLPDKIEFIDDKDVVQIQEVSYEWKPRVCSQCSGIGHDAVMYRKRAVEMKKKPNHKVWRPKDQGPAKPSTIPVQEVPQVQCVENVQEAEVLPQLDPSIVVTPIPFKGNVMASPGSLVHRMSRVKIKNKDRIHAGFGSPWQIIDNSEVKDSGRIWCNKDSDTVYLWNSMISLKATVNGPWLIMRDFNNVLYLDERIGSQVTDSEVREFQNCVDVCGLYDMISTGAYFTWNNKQEGDARVFSRIDRVLANDEWILNGPTGVVSFLPEELYDHSPCLIELGEDTVRRKGSFKYFNKWGKSANFKNIVTEIWRQPIQGCCMFQLVKKLKTLKHPLKKLNNNGYGDIENTAMVAKLVLESIQKQLHIDPRNVLL